MARLVTVTATVLAGALALAGCIPAYRAPRPGEPAALVKVKLAYDHARALSLIPADGHGRSATVSLLAREGARTYAVATQALPELLASPEAAPLESISAQLHAGRPVALQVNFSVHWSTTSWEWVTRTEQVSKQVTRPVARQVARTESYYDSMSKSTQFRTVYATEFVTETVTELVTETKQVWEPVTRAHALGCTAEVPLKPQKDAVYLVDYANLAVAENCSAAVFQQWPQPGGTFALRPVEPAGIQVVPSAGTRVEPPPPPPPAPPN